SRIDPDSIDYTDTSPVDWFRILAQAPVLLVVGVDLRVVASADSKLDRIGVISGASVYPFVQNLLLAARGHGLAGALTTFIAAPGGREARAAAAAGVAAREPGRRVAPARASEAGHPPPERAAGVALRPPGALGRPGPGRLTAVPRRLPEVHPFGAS